MPTAYLDAVMAAPTGHSSSPRTNAVTDDIKFYTTNQVAEIFQVKNFTVRNWIEQGQVRAAKVNGQWRIPQTEVTRLADEFMEAGNG